MDEVIERMEHAARTPERIRERRAEHERTQERLRTLDACAQVQLEAARMISEVR